MVRPTVISTFAGGGGSSLGYKMAGFKELLAVEWDDNAVETLKLNFPGLKIFHGDIKELSVKKCLSMAGIKKGGLDILDGSPPCQGFSTAGKRKVNDSRNDLFKEFVRLITGIQPKVFVMENVSGLVKGKMKGLFIEIMKDLKSLNYNVKCKLLNAMWYEVPQSRERLIWIGIRKDLNKDPIFPEKVLKKPITVKEAINKSGEIHRGVGFDKNTRTTNRVANTIKIKYHNNRFGDIILNKNKPSQTIVKINRYFWDDFVPLEIEDIKTLCSFPKEYKFYSKNYNKQYAILGNSVPPKMMYHIAKTIKDQILKRTAINQ